MFTDTTFQVKLMVTCNLKEYLLICVLFEIFTFLKSLISQFNINHGDSSKRKALPNHPIPFPN